MNATLEVVGKQPFTPRKLIITIESQEEYEWLYDQFYNRMAANGPGGVGGKELSKLLEVNNPTKWR